MTQPLHPLFADKKYDHAVFCLFFIGGCAILGMIHSYLKKIEPTTTEHKKTQSSGKKISHDELVQQMAALTIANEETKKFELNVKQVLARQEKNISDLTKKCDELTQKNEQLCHTVNNMHHKANGYVPALMAAYWLHQYIQQVRINNNYNQNIPNNNPLLLNNNE
jgi:hypothetical protein